MDIKGADGVPDTMLKYPATPKKVTSGPPGDGKDVGIFGLTNTPVPPSVDGTSTGRRCTSGSGSP